MKRIQHDMAVKWLDSFPTVGWPTEAVLTLEYVKECVNGVPAIQPTVRGTLRDYSTSELMAEYMRRDGCG